MAVAHKRWQRDALIRTMRAQHTPVTVIWHSAESHSAGHVTRVRKERGISQRMRQRMAENSDSFPPPPFVVAFVVIFPPLPALLVADFTHRLQIDRNPGGPYNKPVWDNVVETRVCRPCPGRFLFVGQFAKLSYERHSHASQP